MLAFQEVRLVPDGTLLIHIALILLMIWVLNRTFFRPINRILEQRARTQGGRSSEAQEITKSIGEKQARFDAAMLEARSEGYELIERTRAQATASRQEKVGAVKAEVAELVARETRELEAQKSAARATLAAEAEQMAERISANVLKTN